MILGPLAAGVGLLCLKPDHLRRILVVGVTLAICAGAVVLARLPAPAGVAVHHHAISELMLVAEVIMGLYLVGAGFRARQPWVVALVIAQTGLMVWFETRYAGELEAVNNLFVDKLSVIMALINGVLGGGICLYALGYMRAYHETHHPEIADRRPLFFSLLFVFMGAMFGIIFSNNLLWFYFFWEVTTLCSFLLIGYSGKPEAIRNSYRALVMNLAGGLAFALAIVMFHRTS
ncbi:MAG TPA: proton-conducting transporter membrane subunit, partial [Candidatus Paceibacterota bacterium]|nr:proton-conducting transporter membrane subunit [Candidatus Paceibacterota bacterium]